MKRLDEVAAGDLGVIMYDFIEKSIINEWCEHCEDHDSRCDQDVYSRYCHKACTRDDIEEACKRIALALYQEVVER